MQENDNYWSSTENDEDNAYFVNLNDGNANFNNDNKDNPNRVRACLAYWVITYMRSE